MNIRVIPPVAASVRAITVNGRSYVGVPGSVYDVPPGDAQVLASNGWTAVGAVGPTASRPTLNASAGPYFVATGGMFYVDTTLNKVIVFDDAAWRDPVTGGAV